MKHYVSTAVYVSTRDHFFPVHFLWPSCFSTNPFTLSLSTSPHCSHNTKLFPFRGSIWQYSAFYSLALLSILPSFVPLVSFRNSFFCGHFLSFHPRAWPYPTETWPFQMLGSDMFTWLHSQPVLKLSNSFVHSGHLVCVPWKILLKRYTYFQQCLQWHIRLGEY